MDDGLHRAKNSLEPLAELAEQQQTLAALGTWHAAPATAMPGAPRAETTPADAILNSPFSILHSAFTRPVEFSRSSIATYSVSLLSLAKAAC